MDRELSNATAGPRPCVLIVDDDREFVEYLRDVLARDFQVLAATTPAEAWALFERHAPRLVIADQRLPEMSGLDLLARIKARDASTVRIMVSGYEDADVVMRALNEELVWRFLRKPCDRERLLAELHAARALVQASAGVRPGFLGC